MPSHVSARSQAQMALFGWVSRLKPDPPLTSPGVGRQSLKLLAYSVKTRAKRENPRNANVWIYACNCSR